MANPVNWQKYENEVFRHFSTQYHDAKVERNVRVTGRYSKVKRQIDVLVEGTVAAFPLRIAVDTKHHARPLNVTDVEAFIGFCADVGAHKGVLIALRGFTSAALARAHNDDSDLELDVLDLSELQQFQAESSIPFSGTSGVLLSAPFGWIVDGTRRPGVVATLYQRGLDLRTAQRAREWMYLNFWHKTPEASSLQELLTQQEKQLRKGKPGAIIEYIDGPARPDARTKVRVFRHSSYPAPEVTGFVEFPRFVFFCVLFTPDELLSRNRRKLDYVLSTVRPLGVKRARA